MRELLKDVRNGDRRARNQLYQTLSMDRRVNRTLQSLLYEHSCVEKEEVKAEFWRGILLGMDVVRHDLGDPIMHLIKRGVWQVGSIVKTELNKRIVQFCTRCGRINGRYVFSRVCEKCKAPVENLSRAVAVDGIDFASEEPDSCHYPTVVKVSRPISCTQYRVLELLIQACLDGEEHPQSVISRILGISRERARQHIAKLKPLLTLD